MLGELVFRWSQKSIISQIADIYGRAVAIYCRRDDGLGWREL